MVKQLPKALEASNVGGVTPTSLRDQGLPWGSGPHAGILSDVSKEYGPMHDSAYAQQTGKEGSRFANALLITLKVI